MEKKVQRFLAVVLLLFAAAGVFAKALAEEYWDWENNILVSPDTCFFLVSEPLGGNRGAAVQFEVVLNEDAEGDLLFRWYEQNDAGEKGALLLETKERFFSTGAFDRPEVRSYWLEVEADGEIAETYSCAAGYTGLPVISLTLKDAKRVYSKDEYQEAEMELIDTDGSRLREEAEIKGRGQATWNYAKKPYKLKFTRKLGLLGMVQHKKWDLLANYCDKTLLRTSIGFETARKLDMAYVPDTRFVELVLNGKYLGNYQLTETVTDGKKDLGISETGYMIEESNYDDEMAFRTKKKELVFCFKEPGSKDVTEELVEAAEKTMNSFENKLYASQKKAFDPEKGYASMIDMDSWAQWFLVQNILANKDPNRYYYRETADGKIKMGPVWDFEWSIGIGWYDGERPNPDHTLVGKGNTLPYFGIIIKDSAFMQNVKEKWDRIYPTLWEELRSFILEKASEIEVSQALNFARWPILKEKISAGGVPLGSWESELECDLSFLESHIEWLNRQIQKRAEAQDE